MSVRALLLTAALTLVLAAPAQAAVVMDPLKPCYVSDGDLPNQRETIHVHATGFTPVSGVTLTLDGVAVAHGISDAFGAITADVPAPFQGQGERDFLLVIVEDQNQQNTDNATARVTNLGVRLRPKRARPSRRIRFVGRGFTRDAPVFGHYLHGGKVRKTVRFKRRTKLPCGVFRAKRRQIPVKRPGTGEWLLQVDQQRRYAALPASNAQRVIIRVTETFKKP
ncbi:MAG TPA: hypothetical protein VFM58_21900 [Solirubrobacteraceae bacterium]|nr:hypothetical protein [Solirubrobacteraceae bacterium]